VGNVSRLFRLAARGKLACVCVVKRVSLGRGVQDTGTVESPFDVTDGRTPDRGGGEVG
jgi:hypothetical protein